MANGGRIKSSSTRSKSSSQVDAGQKWNTEREESAMRKTTTMTFAVLACTMVFGDEPSTLQRDLQAFPASEEPDVMVFAKAAEWIIRHDEFYSDDYYAQTKKALEVGAQRAKLLQEGKTPWRSQIGMTVRGYRSKVDQSIQPYAVTLPTGFDLKAKRSWPLHVVLHGRAGKMNEVNFIHKYNDKPVNDENKGWIQLDVFGRTNNAYRWSGETDVFEAIQSVKSQYQIDDDRVVLRGFSMGGAGAWHLGMHHPDLFCSVGPGAGFVDFYKYQKQTTQLPAHQHATLGIYDSINYAQNAYNTPTCTYGGEKDSQLVAGKSMHDAAAKLGINIKLIVGPNMGHKFDPASRKEFMEFHVDSMKRGRVAGPDRESIKFTTRTLRYNQCDWITIEEQHRVYAPSHVDAHQSDRAITIKTKNVRALRVTLPTTGRSLSIDGESIPVEPTDSNFIVQRTDDAWTRIDAEEFEKNSSLHKRHRLQGPIDDAFMDAFVCIAGSTRPWSPQHETYSQYVLDRFAGEFDKWLRARLPRQSSSDLDLSADKNLVLFGDPGSNPAIASVIERLPIRWTKERITVGTKSFSTVDHSLAMIYPNPMNPKRYVVLNSGHTFHEKDFKSSNAWLFPRLGDIAVQKFTETDDGKFREETVWAASFSADWELDD